MSEAKKIIIDEDWKSQVHAEKEAAAHGQGSETAPDPGPQMPPASFQLHISTLASEAMIALGQIPNPLTGQTSFHPGQARYFIDTIEILRDKSQGNLTPDEEEGIKSLLHQLRMAFLAGPPEE